MSIELKKGDIFAEDAEAIVNTVNCIGIMGRGIALQSKKKFPENFTLYEKACKSNQVRPGKMFVYETYNAFNPKYIINFPTKRHWRSNSRIKDIELGLYDLVEVINENQIKSIAIPPLGCGLGGLNWSDVRALLFSFLETLTNVEIMIYEPAGAPEAVKMVKSVKVPTMTAGRAALIELIYRYLKGMLDPFITLLEVHKLMYFMQESGESLKLRFTEAAYGPFAENLSHVLHTIEGHYISGYADGGDDPQKRLNLLGNAYNQASEFLKEHNDTRENFNRVSDLVDGFESPYGLELLSTVHWVVTKNNTKSLKDVIDQVYSWNQRKRQFTQRQIQLAINTLLNKGWIQNID